MFFKIDTFPGAGPVKDDTERAFRGQRRVELFERTGGGIARICKQRQTCLASLLVQLCEAAFVHVNLTAHFEYFRGPPAQLFRHRANGFNVARDIVADQTVAAGGGVTQLSFFVNERNGHAVHLWLNHDRDCFIRQEARDARVKVGDFFFGVSVVQAEHRQAVLDLGESLERPATHALGRRIGRDQRWDPRFKVDELFVETVVFLVADRGSRLFVITAVVLFDLAPQLFDPLRCLSLVFGHKA